MGPQSGVGDTDGHVMDRLVDYLDGALPAADELAIDRHLLHCTQCRTEYDELSTVVLMLTAQPLPGDDPHTD
jgi:anti-sigma factor RsiW